MMNSKHFIAFAAMAIFFISGCFGSGKLPLETLYYKSASNQNKNLIVFLRGMGGTLNCPIDAYKCFATEGFVTAVQQRGLPYDMVAPNAHFNYYRERTLVQRLQQDVIGPARKSGYQKIWLVGVSMGGLGALLYLKERTADIDGVLALGPKLDDSFLGNGAIIDEIGAAGGLAKWQPGSFNPQDDWPRMLWAWLKQYDRLSEHQPPIYLGIGTGDDYYRAQKLLADDLPPGRVIEVGGSHQFSTFKKAWDIFLDKGVLQ